MTSHRKEGERTVERSTDLMVAVWQVEMRQRRAQARGEEFRACDLIWTWWSKLTVVPLLSCQTDADTYAQTNPLFIMRVLKGIQVKREVSLSKSEIHSKAMRVDTSRAFVYLTTCLERRFYCAYFIDETSHY